MNNFTVDEALRLGLMRFRELHPEGTLQRTLEDNFTFNIRPGRDQHTLQIHLWASDNTNPTLYFEAVVDRATKSVRVTVDAGGNNK